MTVLRRNYLRYSPPLALLALCLLGYLPLAYRLGFYWDDWPSIWFYHLWGPKGLLEGLAIDRPALAWSFILTSSLGGESTIAWQALGILTRWLASVAFWWLLRSLWPQNHSLTFGAAALFALYPGFNQQYIAVTYSNGFLVLTLALFSLASMTWAWKTRQWRWPLLGASLLSQAAHLAMAEYFYGLELLRPLLLRLGAEQNGEHSSHPWRQAFMRWGIHLILYLPFLIDRIFFHKTPRGQVTLFSRLLTEPLATLLDLLKTFLEDFWQVNFLAWVNGLNLEFVNTFESTVVRLFYGVGIASAIFFFAYTVSHGFLSRSASLPQNKVIHQGLQAIFLSLVAFFCAAGVIWATNLHIDLIFPWDRFTLITLAGSALLIAGLANTVIPHRWLKALFLALLMGVSASLQFQHRLEYRQEWLAQRNFFWRLVWRAPAIQEGSTLLTSELPFVYYSDNSLSAPLNWIYAPNPRSREMPYLLYDVEARLGVGLPAIQPDQEIRVEYRATTFRGSTSQAVVLFYDPPRCLKVVDPWVDRFLPMKPLYIRELTPLSKPGLIQVHAESTPVMPSMLNPEPPPSWCYYFEKAERYNQAGEWQKAAQMADRALKMNKNFTEKTISELFPFIEAYAHNGRWKEALNLSLQAYQFWDQTRYPLCDYWARIAMNTEPTPQQQNALRQIEESLQCNLP